MQSPEEIAGPFIEMAHRIVWATVTTVGEGGVPRSRVLHPIWERSPDLEGGAGLVGWILTVPTPLKRAHLEVSPWVSVNYWSPEQDVATAECRAELLEDDATCRRVWDLFAAGPEPVGYDPTIVPGWDSPDSEAVAVMRLDPWRLRVFPGTMLLAGEGDILTWSSARD